VPVPLSKKKLRWRGFNQAEEIAKELANFLKIPLISDCLIKTKETKDQVELSEKERKENVKGAFYIKNKEKIAGKNVLLVDDVFTTGATMEEAAKVLNEAGSEKIVGVVVAKASPGQDKLT
jgi:ComF family protein